MITHIKGRLTEKNPTYVVIDCNGVGYHIHISLNTYGKIGGEEALFLYTYLQVREDSHTLFGFADKAERAVFQLLISVSGIGANTARTMLSSLVPEEVKNAIVQNDVATIQSVKGIGAKTAQRVILDLKDKILKVEDIAEVSAISNNTNKEEALSALEVLGFARRQSEKLVQKALRANPSLSVEELIKFALKNL
ncbi:MAG: Holliday junction branch migration protein RuvA [Flavobacteriaceae bacterium]|nr:Holliday junction branch migration protein RuvA [Flavobacteriaceae bacterium]